MRRVVAPAAAATLAGGVLWGAAAVERTSPARSAAEDLLYLPNGRHLELLSLSHASLVADLVYLWAIQYYSNYDRADRFRYVEHVFGDVIGELDPHYADPYWLGALILTVEADDLEGGLRLLDRGFENNPEAWIFPYLGAWELYRASDFRRAAAWFDRAAAVPGAPPIVLRMRAGMFQKAGALDESIEMWRAVLESPDSDATSIAIAERQIRDLHVRRDVHAIEAAVAAFRTDNGRGPRRLEQLVRGGYLDRLPQDPEGRPYVYDPATGGVTSVAGRILGAS
jgi:tetratricopeptide (TPR) repeat protein